MMEKHVRECEEETKKKIVETPSHFSMGWVNVVTQRPPLPHRPYQPHTHSVTSPSTYTSNHIFLHACYDMVLWDEISSGGFKMEGLRELITNVQVKKKIWESYIKLLSTFFKFLIM